MMTYTVAIDPNRASSKLAMSDPDMRANVESKLGHHLLCINVLVMVCA